MHRTLLRIRAPPPRLSPAGNYRQYWHVRWFTVEGGSFHVLYLVVLCAVAFLWRPAANNTRCAWTPRRFLSGVHVLTRISPRAGGGGRECITVARVGMEQLPTEDLGDIAMEDIEGAVGATSAVLSGSVTTDRVRSRSKRGASAGGDAAADEAAEALKWAEQNIPGLDDEDVDALAAGAAHAADDEQAQLIRTELSKLN